MFRQRSSSDAYFPRCNTAYATCHQVLRVQAEHKTSLFSIDPPIIHQRHL